ncbi:MAG: sigma 54-interacting transcriptional regulator [Anaerohalosphaeraceae bacterium]
MAKKSDRKNPQSSKTDYSIEDLEVIFQLEKVIRFEKLLSTLAAAFTNLPPDQVDHEIKRGLGLVAEFLGADRAGILNYSDDRQTLELTHRYVAEGIAPHPFETLNAKDMSLWYKKTLETMGVVVFENLPDDLPSEAKFERKHCIEQGIKSNIALPLWTGQDEPDGYIGFVFLREKRTWLPQCIERIHFIGQLFANVLRHKQNEERLKKAYIKIEELSKGLDAEIQATSGYDAPLKCIGAESGYEGMLGHSDAMEAVMAQIKKVACTDSTVLVFGETGTGKELAARAIHQLSARRDKPMVRVNCAAIPESLIESELFGHEKGAFTGADSTRMGRFEIADGSTIFLDEIGELPLAMQAKLLHVLELQQLERVGGSETIDIDVRVVAATNKDLAAEVKAGSFREDLFYRLNIFPIQVPPLRQRKEDIPMLAWTFIQEFSSKMGKVIEKPLKAMEVLKDYPWPGNVRELRNVIERSMILTEGKDLNIKIPRSLGSVHSQSTGLEDVERDHITEILSMTGWKVRGENGAAQLLQLKPSTLESKMQKLGIKRPG